VAVPYATHTLFVHCAPRQQRQFAGILRVLERLAARRGAHALDWGLEPAGGLPLAPEPLDLRRRRSLQRLLISGHGSEERAAFSSPGAVELTPSHLRLPARCSLYLLGCYQGGEPFRRAWAQGAGVVPGQVHGSEGETESALTTCLLLHLMEDGVESLPRWFPEWQRCNQAFRPRFALIRANYAGLAGDPVRTLRSLVELPAAQSAAGFLAVIERHPEFLTGLA
jgi:hypothetical protein